VNINSNYYQLREEEEEEEEVHNHGSLLTLKEGHCSSLTAFLLLVLLLYVGQ